MEETTWRRPPWKADGARLSVITTFWMVPGGSVTLIWKVKTSPMAAFEEESCESEEAESTCTIVVVSATGNVIVAKVL